MIYNDQKLPPLKSLAAFLACAQKQSFTEAAKVLHVTHSAISQNIRNLEEFFGASLFIRGPKRQTKLTEKGERYFREIERAFSILFNATQRELSETTDNILTVNLLTTLAFNWLIPRLPEFQAIHPECDLRVSTRGITVDFVHDAIDINITYGTTSQREGLYSHFLFPDQLILVANQDLFSRYKTPEKIIESTNAIMVDSQLRKRDWQQWCKGAGTSLPSKKQRLYFQNTPQALQAVNSGLGAMVTHKPYVMDALTSGQLKQLSSISVNLTEGYYLTCLNETLTKPHVKPFCKWIEIIAKQARTVLDSVL